MGIRIRLTAFLNANLGIILLIIGVATKHWAGRESKKMNIYEGLWTKCTHHKHDENKDVWCRGIETTFGHSETQFLAIVIFLFMACFLHIVSFVIALILFFKEGPVLEKVLAGIQLFILLFTITGLAIYATQYDNNYYTLKWSYALGWGATLCMFAALVFTIIDIDRKRRT